MTDRDLGPTAMQHLLAREDWDHVFAVHPEPFIFLALEFSTEALVAHVQEVIDELTTPQRKAIPILVHAPLRYSPSGYPKNDRGYVRHDVLRRMVDKKLAVELPIHDGEYGYRSTALAYAVYSLPPRLRRRKRRRKTVPRSTVRKEKS